ncbi:Trehalose transport system permease protein SugB [Streptomyces lavendulae subsp. lavendulae]|uniref:Trehalose transport system permease protein SugB n=1 Tax=Streptomyces lavendulae subsp. lavendulae TaxID=58340 RepID=A0A2K8PFZ6_STRLA|nr:Trehalose transport system permease protein SugB [Streptomyces lavendulae subsp. lavendulae]QUQ54375.1 Diacetylchitobiose uptake system permease protein DasC [Streptomyces lavendulae subsp. lavendulae]GLV80878.1 sugar ABC transporter permease [Streptomyces lavendulae subsp. lavendulae]GLV99620.1 sugar ABC transporter permease [Streptomyces lavendulae subsp. lavendulae]GLX35483.1 sugar ABC transporter permease [Streptomyces roseochromogenus]
MSTTTAPKPAPTAPSAQPAQRLRTRGPLRPATVAKNLGALLLALLFLFPVYWMFSSALKPSSEILTKDPVFVFTPTMQNFEKATGVDNFWTYVTNSLVVTVSAVLLALLVALAASFAIARMRFRGRKGMVLAVMMAQMAPWEVMVIAMYMILRDAEMLNSLPMLTAIYFVMVLPFTIWTLRGFIAAVPVSLEEAAQIDGCTRGQAFRKVIFPLLAPGLMSTSLFGFITAWNEFAMVLILNKDKTAQTLPLWLTQFKTAFGNDWGATMAASSLFAVPVLLIFIFLQRKAVGGMTAGAVKG